MKIVTFGEIMLRLSPDGSRRFMQEPSLKTYFGGSEANTAVALSQLGIDSSFVTKLPNNDIADACIRELSSFGVDVSSIARGGERMGIYFCENGAGIRPGKVIYDRKNSSVSTAQLSDFNTESIFANSDIFHITGITPALSDSLAETTLFFVKEAKKKGIKVSCDLNYRSMLWSKEKANRIMTALMPYVDILFANEGSVSDVFGIKADSDETLASALTEKFGFELVALTSRKVDSADYNTLSGMIYKDGKAYYSEIIPVHIIDRVGGGDAFNAGVLYGMAKGLDMQETVNIANAANALKHTVEGDYIRISPDELLSASSGNIDGRIKR